MGKLTVQSLWVGDRLSRMEYYSIKSFLNLGYEFHLYTYNKVKNVPKGTKIKDASKIMPFDKVFSLKKSFLPFSDIWRYKLLYEKGGYWVDLDMIAIKRFDFKEPYIFSAERTMKTGAFASRADEVTHIGILKAPPKSEFYKEIYEKCLKYNNTHVNKDKIKYMKMLRKQVEKYDDLYAEKYGKKGLFKKYVKPASYFCNLDWWHAKEAFSSVPIHKWKSKWGVKLPTLESMFNGPYTIHFWRDKLTKAHKLDLDAKYDDNSLWEITLKYIDN